MSLEFISNEHMLFPTPLWQVQIKGVDNEALKEYAYNLKDNTEGVIISNRGGWHSKEILEPIPDALNNLFSNFELFSKLISSYISFNDKTSLRSA